jgi:hypothetical protein
MPAYGYLQTLFTGTVAAAGLVNTHALGTTPDFIHIMPTNTTFGPALPFYAVTTFNTITCTLVGPATVTARVFVRRLHTITG